MALAVMNGLTVAGQRIQNVADPTTSTDAATKNYVDHHTFVSVTDYGATGNGTTDDTSAINSALAAASTVFFPPGTYKCGSSLMISNGTRLVGSGIDSEINYTGSGTLITLTNQQDVTFESMSFALANAATEAIVFSNTFLCQMDRVRIRGQHTDKTVSTYQGQIGVELKSNTGNVRMHSVHFANLGIGVKTSCIQNEITNSRFTNCWKSVWGTGNSATAGLVLLGVEFVGTGTSPLSTYSHVHVDGSANTFVFNGCWFEGTDYALIIGDSTNGGPSSMSLISCKIAARTVGIQWNYCRQPSVIGCEFNLDTGSTMTEMTFPGSGLNYEGIGLNNITTLRSDFAVTDYPQYWNTMRRGSANFPNLTVSSTAVISGNCSAGGFNANSNKVTNVTDPTVSSDAATKNYVDGTSRPAALAMFLG